MAVENVCQHEDCAGWCYQRNHIIHGSENKVATVEQFGSLFTKDGRRYPDQVPVEIRDRIYVPPHFQHLAEKAKSLPPAPAVDTSILSEIEGLAEPADDDYEVIQLARGIKQRQPKPNTGPQKIGR